MKPNIEYVSSKLIKPYWNNPRMNDDAVEGLKKSITEYGFLVPLVVDKDYVIVTGHTRFKASNDLGLDEVPVIVANHLDEAQIKAFRLADNRLSENAKWDETKLSEELRSLGEMGFSLEFTGFTKDELDCLCGLITADCLKDLDYKTVCGDVTPVSFKATDTMPITVGPYRFAVPVKVFKAWETDMIAQFPKIPNLRLEIGRRLGLHEYFKVDEVPVDAATAPKAAAAPAVPTEA